MKASLFVACVIVAAGCSMERQPTGWGPHALLEGEGGLGGEGATEGGAGGAALQPLGNDAYGTCVAACAAQEACADVEPQDCHKLCKTAVKQAKHMGCASEFLVYASCLYDEADSCLYPSACDEISATLADCMSDDCDDDDDDDDDDQCS